MLNIFAFEFEANLNPQKFSHNTMDMSFHEFGYGFPENPYPNFLSYIAIFISF